jgi:hypothetical protein
MMDMIGHKSAGPLKDMFYPSFVSKLIFIKMIDMCIKSDSANEHVQSAMVDPQ